MKITTVLLLSALSVTCATAQPATTMSGACASLMFAPGHGSSRDVYWTTYTASRRLPLNKRTSEGRLHSLEFRPRAGQPGVYEADYILVSGTTVIEFGSVTLNLPVDDADTNGIPDLVQFDRGIDVAISGNVQPDFVRDGRVTRENFNGTLQRGAGEFEGDYAFAFFADGESIADRFRILSYDGTVTYQRGARSSSMTTTLTRHIEGAPTRTATLQYRVLTPDKVLIPAQWVSVEGGRSRVHRVILNRVGNRYVFTPNKRDGNPGTPWKDYVYWIEQIVDPTDSDGDGVPDFSDSDAAVQSSFSGASANGVSAQMELNDSARVVTAPNFREAMLSPSR